MVVINKQRRLFIKQHRYGLGNITYKSIKGDGIISDSIKNLGKLLFSSGKKVFGFIKPRAITFVKDTLKDIKPKVELSSFMMCLTNPKNEAIFKKNNN